MNPGLDDKNDVSETPMISEKKPIKTTKRNQYLAGVAVSFGGFCAGTVLAWTSPALEFILDNHNTTNANISTDTNATTSTPPGFKISTTEEAFVGATLMLGALLFAIPSGKCADMFGRKFTIILIALMYLINYILIACASNVLMLIVARFFAGLAMGGCCVVSPMYVGEIAEESLRGVLGSLFSVLLGLGMVYANVIGIFANWLWLSLGLALPALGAVVIMFFFPDSPIYLVSVEKFGKAKGALLFLRGDETVVIDELMSLQKGGSQHEENNGTLRDLFTKKRYRLPIIAGLGVFTYQQLCGINVVVLYLVPIFKEGGNAVSPMLAATTTNVISLLVGIVSMSVIEKRDRKYFLMLSAISMLVGTTGLGLAFQLKGYGITFPGLQFLPVVCVIFFMAAFAVGMGPVPWILLIELYTPEIRGIANGVIIVSSWLSAFLVTFCYPYMLESIGSAVTFYLYSLMNVLGCLFIWFVVPETRPKAL